MLEQTQDSEPDLIELTALASVLHSIYNGIEKIFVLIAKKVDKDLPEGKQWHKEILIKMTQAGLNRDAVISENLKEKLLPYLAFRHFYRHSYSYVLTWTELEKLVVAVFDVWEETKEELNAFMCKFEKH
ncbi:MAG: hypothetical protein PHI90_10425 [Clostridia bacterium]|nr:hypothetical protein [Clostridia bacterium]MDD4049203.1 hypothetical protein [Clostridia bacterium]